MGVEILVSVALLFAGIALLVSVHVCIVRRAFIGDLDQEGGGNHMVQASSTGPKVKGMSTEELKRLPCLDYEAAGDEGLSSRRTTDCAVCLESFRVGDKCRLLPNCEHCFHAQCVDVWLRETPLCPVCRACTITPLVHIVLCEASNSSTSILGEEQLT